MDLQLAIAILALLIGTVALRLTLSHRPAPMIDPSGEVAALRERLQTLESRVSELQSAVDVPPPPPIPRARPAARGLDDLQERLRASARESTESGDEPA